MGAFDAEEPNPGAAYSFIRLSVPRVSRSMKPLPLSEPWGDDDPRAS